MRSAALGLVVSVAALLPAPGLARPRPTSLPACRSACAGLRAQCVVRLADRRNQILCRRGWLRRCRHEGADACRVAIPPGSLPTVPPIPTFTTSTAVTTSTTIPSGTLLPIMVLGSGTELVGTAWTRWLRIAWGAHTLVFYVFTDGDGLCGVSPLDITLELPGNPPRNWVTFPCATFHSSQNGQVWTPVEVSSFFADVACRHHDQTTRLQTRISVNSCDPVTIWFDGYEPFVF